MTSETTDPRLVRVERGAASAEELAAVTALLMARAARSEAPRPAPALPRTAGWRRLERVSAYRVPRSWQS
ncbi:acyl-CoA carboxylase subunit epsilon [Streptomyces profundus]|uniref:acyl-CoA carboxylase subunit epsilon n=1 Tax=Streptomyces profundus TaxID=2867410 RepID=UPI001D1661E1|nr:acyl-CoA carboxylase subunit epsilon [Streptomyces sp. MA3_2.13]UED86830.1 acyl-CoA carboxylase subunit epsilon [Streptomyces sp. MA3_2.13]